MTIPEKTPIPSKFSRRHVGIALRWFACLFFLIHLFLPTMHELNLFGGPEPVGTEIVYGYESTLLILIAPVFFLIPLILNVNIPTLENVPFTLYGLCLLVLLVIVTFDNILLITAPFHSKLIRRQQIKRGLFGFMLAFIAFIGISSLCAAISSFSFVGHYVWFLSNIFLLISSYIGYQDGKKEL